MKGWIAAVAALTLTLMPMARMETTESSQSANRPGDICTAAHALCATSTVLSSAEQLDSRALSEAANAEGEALVFESDNDTAIWPMLPTREADRLALKSSNANVDGSRSVVHTTLTSCEGDVLAFDFRVSCESVYDGLSIAIDGEMVKWFTGEHTWTSWVIALPEGTHRVSFIYEKDEYNHNGEDCALIDEVRLVHGNEGQVLLDGLPKYPVSERFDMTLLDDSAREVLLDDSDRVADGIFGKRVRYYIVNGERETLELTLTADSDPERAFVYHAAEGSSITLSQILTEDRSAYRVTLPMNHNVEGARYNCVYAYSGVLTEEGEETAVLVLFSGETGAEDFMNSLAQNGIDIGWHYADESPAPKTRPKLEPGQYRVSTIHNRNM